MSHSGPPAPYLGEGKVDRVDVGGLQPAAALGRDHEPILFHPKKAGRREAAR